MLTPSDTWGEASESWGYLFSVAPMMDWSESSVLEDGLRVRDVCTGDQEKCQEGATKSMRTARYFDGTVSRL